jgi:predicted nucleic acid-binding protein
MHAVFVDSNILIYSQDATDSHKQARAQDWLEHLWQNRSGRISYQVLREVYLNLTRKVPNPLPAPRVRALVRLFFPWNPRPQDSEFFEVAWDVETRFQLSWWDSMIVAAAHLSECRFLLTEDLQNRMQLNDLTVIDPFSISWEALFKEIQE